LSSALLRLLTQRLCTSIAKMTPTNSKARLESVIISPSTSIGEAIARLDEAGTGALALCSDDQKLVGLLTDGDIRRAILKSRLLDDSCSSISSMKPIKAVQPVSSIDALRLMNRHDINHLPVVDADGVLHDFILRRELGPEVEFEATALQRLESVVISPTTSIAEAIAALDKAGTGALVLCTNDRILCGLLTDGDIRRAILQGKPMHDACVAIASRKPVVATSSISAGEALHLMNQHDLNHLPVVDAENRLMDFLLRKDLVADVRSDLSAVIMAGGYGKRLLPLTESVPKPMLPVGDRPLLELTIQQLRRSGIRDVNVTTHYLSESIVNHFGDGQGFGVRLNYLKEDHPMGTAGGLKQMKRPDSSFLVINGDILTSIPFQEMLVYHRKHGAMLTVGVRKYDMQVPFGVVECKDVRVTTLEEKPSLSFFINAGTYLLEPSAYDYIPEGRPFDMTELIQKLLDAGRPVVGFPIMEYWTDIGKQADYQQAQEDVRNGSFK
jgi:dTDP-glucose pyrophosphorylase/CBS domain-containing protein